MAPEQIQDALEQSYRLARESARSAERAQNLHDFRSSFQAESRKARGFQGAPESRSEQALGRARIPELTAESSLTNMRPDALLSKQERQAAIEARHDSFREAFREAATSPFGRGSRAS
jgi:hypothetical protein